MNIIGHQKIIKFLDKAYEENQLVGAYLFSGPSGVGKFHVALYLAEKILGQNSKQIRDDLVILESKEESAAEKPIDEKKEIQKTGKKKNGGKEIKVDDIREFKRKLFLSSESGRKVAIIRGAEKLNKSSQNALLKILEEPNQGLTLILVADEEKKLFPTIISRCQKIRFGIVSNEEIKRLIESREKKLSVKVKQAIIFWSIGCPGLALEMLENSEKLEFKIQSFLEVQNLLYKTISDKFALAENLAKNPSLALVKMDVWIVGIRESLLKDELKGVSREKGLAILEKISESQGLLRQTNANIKLVLENMLLAFSQN